MGDGPPSERLNISWLTASLAVGGAFPVEAVQRLTREHGITHVVDLSSEGRDQGHALAEHGIRLLHLPTADNCAIARADLHEGVRWVREVLETGERVLIHCEHGIGRSPLLALCVLVDRGMPPLEAMELAKEARAAVSPSPEQLRAFIAFARHHRRGSGARWLVPSFGALAAIAYRQLRAAGGGSWPPGAPQAG